MVTIGELQLGVLGANNDASRARRSAVKLTDLLIAATAIEHGLPVVTQDRDFERVAGAHPALRVAVV